MGRTEKKQQEKEGGGAFCEYWQEFCVNVAFDRKLGSTCQGHGQGFGLQLTAHW